MNTARILMLEPDPDDRFISSEFISQSKHRITIDFVLSSDELLASLQLQRCADISKPCLILMNQKSAPEDIISILKQLKSLPDYRAIPVIILGDGAHEKMTHAYYDAGASSFILKPRTYEETRVKIESFLNYWFSTVTLF